MTEEQAKTKQCRQIIAMMQPVNAASIANPNVPPAFGMGIGNCVGSLCMGWRWQNQLDTEHRQGYCGFAGKP